MWDFFIFQSDVFSILRVQCVAIECEFSCVRS